MELKLRVVDKFADARLGALVAAVNSERVAGFPSGRLFMDSIEQALAIALVAAALAFFLSLFVAIVVLLAIGFFRHVDMAVTYRLIALPIAVATFPTAMIASLWWQARPRRVPRT